MYRAMAIDQLKEGIQSGLRQQDGEDDATFEVRRKLIQNNLKQIEDMVNEADQFTIGWAIDRQTRSTYLDVDMTARQNSDLAKKFANFKASPSSYSGFTVPKSALALGGSQVISKEDAEQGSAALDGLKTTFLAQIDKSDDIPDAATKTAIKGIVTDLVEALRGTMLSGKSDGALSVMLGAKTLTGVAGLYVADPTKVESALKKLGDLPSKDPNRPKIKFNSDKYGDVRFHTVQLPVPPNEDLAKVVGSTLDVVVGIGAKSVYVGLGTDALGAVKKAIDKSKADATKPAAPGFAILSVQPIVEFAGAMEPNPLNQALAAELAKVPGKDHIEFQIKPITNGISYHIEVQEGVLNLLGVVAKMQNGPPGGGGANFGPPGAGNPKRLQPAR
jgi:hypothetical protein